MMRYLKFSEDEDEKISAKDSLLKWVQHQTEGYASVDVKNFTSSFSNGLALCALVHKFRPDLIAFDSLSPTQPEVNVNVALEAARKYFHFEAFLTASEVLKLDEKVYTHRVVSLVPLSFFLNIPRLVHAGLPWRVLQWDHRASKVGAFRSTHLQACSVYNHK